MKFAGPLVVLLFTLATARADVIANGDFHDGKAHWKGDIHEAGGSDHYDAGSITQPGTSASGVTLELNSRPTWPDMHQTFNSHDTSFNYSLTFKLSPDYAPKPPPAGGVQTGITNGSNFLSSVLRGPYKADLLPPKDKDFMLLIVDLEAGLYSTATITPNAGSTDPQTVIGTITGVPPHDEKVFYLVVNRGAGSITFLNVALTPVTADQKKDDSILKP